MSLDALTATANPALPCLHAGALAWVQSAVKLCNPDRIHWCDGSLAEKEALTELAVGQGILIPLNSHILPRCYYHRSHPTDVARVEQCTFICSEKEQDAGPTNHWADPIGMRSRLEGLLAGSMAGRTMYVIPYLMGPERSPYSRMGIEITDSVYVALSMGRMTRMGQVAWQHLGHAGHFSRGLHSMLDLDPGKRFIAHFPEGDEVISTSSNYGGNVLLSKKCFALRLASCAGRREGWLAEHMLIIGVESPRGEKTYIAAAFPSSCGKTNLAMLVPPEQFHGWKVWTVGDDIAWMHVGIDGRLHAINPENGYFGVVPGTSARTNPNAMTAMRTDTIYTNVALTHDMDVWWEGKDGQPPAECLDWQGRVWTPRSPGLAAHPNSRFTAPARNNPAIAREFDDPSGVPISAIIFGGRRATTFPLIFQSFNWSHGVYLGATMGSETTAAASGVVGTVRRDPMAMLPFCGYNMGDYFAHWLAVGKSLSNPPRIFHVNWFRKDAQGGYLWPGFGDNMRVVKWIVDRCHGRAEGQETTIGWMPRTGAIDLHGLEGVDLAGAQAIDPAEWQQELTMQKEFFDTLGKRMPKDLLLERELLMQRLA